MHHFGLTPVAPLAAATIALKLRASLMILMGLGRWLGGLALALFTLLASLLVNRFWSVSGPDRFMLENGFFEHLGWSAASCWWPGWTFANEHSLRRHRTEDARREQGARLVNRFSKRASGPG
jgi:uncharacterized membrane protein YphA (DoxX/SURF4 family)